jgi:hypothetical protein
VVRDEKLPRSAGGGGELRNFRFPDAVPRHGASKTRVNALMVLRCARETM